MEVLRKIEHLDFEILVIYCEVKEDGIVDR